VHGDVKVWDLSRWAEVCTYRGHDGRIEALAISPDGRIVASAHQPKEIAARMRARRGPIPEIPVPIHVWDASSGTELFKLAGHTIAINALAFSFDGKTVISAAANAVQSWDVETGRRQRELDPREARAIFNALTFSPNGKLRATAAGREIKLWDVLTDQEIVTLPRANLSESDNSPIIALAWTSDGHRLRAGLRDGSIVELRDE